MNATRLIKEKAVALGFDAVGIAGLEPIEARGHFEAWIAAERHGSMSWLATARSRGRRADPARILPGIVSVVCVALCHEPARDPARVRRLGRIASYAAGEDYHRIMRDQLGALERFIECQALPGSRALWYSDTGAILERGFAERAGIGWAGKHAGVLSTTLGSWFLLGEVLVDRALEPDPPASEHCDVCQEVCPWNRFAPPARAARLHARALEGWSLKRFLTLDDNTFMRLFEGSPIRRTRRAGFLRNVCVALGNRREAAAVPALARALASDPEWLVRSHAAWALGEIGLALAAEGAACSVEEIAAALARTAADDASGEVRGEATGALERLGYAGGD